MHFGQGRVRCLVSLAQSSHGQKETPIGSGDAAMQLQHSGHLSSAQHLRRITVGSADKADFGSAVHESRVQEELGSSR